MTRRILQFGTSRFLQAHVDLFVHEAQQSGQNIGPITIVKTTTEESRTGRIEALHKNTNFPIRLRGYDHGRLIDETIVIRSVTRALDAHKEWNELVRIFIDEIDIIVSNASDRGYDLSNVDKIQPQSGIIPEGYPAKLLILLIKRFENGARPLTILPCELVTNNGRILRETLNTLSNAWGESTEFTAWLANSVVICNTLADRIVSESIEPIGAVAEPYGLWAIQREYSFEPPFKHPKIIYTDDLEPFLRLKLHILNLGHTLLAEIWKNEHRRENETVAEILLDTNIKHRLLQVYNEEIIPGFGVQGMADEATQYVTTTMERLENPFLNHRLSDIAQNHSIKIERRIIDFIAWVKKRDTSLSFQHLTTFIQSK